MGKLCECGCGRPVAKQSSRFVRGHHPNGKFVKGQIPWNKGLTKADSRVAAYSDHPCWSKGKTKETDSRLAAISEKLKSKMSGGNNPMYGKSNPHSAKWCKNQSIKMRGRTRKNDPGKAAQAEKMKVLMAGKNNPMYGKTPWNKGKTKETDPILKQVSESYKRRFADPEFCKRWGEAHHVQPSQLELNFGAFLDELFPSEYKYVGDLQLVIGGKCPDFANCNGQKKLIEFNSEYYHSEEVIGLPREEAEQERINHFKQYGFDTLVVWESDFLNSRDRIKQQLIKFHKQ